MPRTSAPSSVTMRTGSRGDLDARVVFGERPEAEPERARISSERVAHEPDRLADRAALDESKPQRRGQGRARHRRGERHGPRDRRAVRRRRRARSRATDRNADEPRRATRRWALDVSRSGDAIERVVDEVVEQLGPDRHPRQLRGREPARRRSTPTTTSARGTRRSRSTSPATCA